MRKLAFHIAEGALSPKAVSDNIDLYTTIISKKRGENKTHLNAVKAAVEDAYRGYNAKLSATAFLEAGFSEPESDALKHCYLSPVEELSNIKGEIFAKSVNRNTDAEIPCPYCLIGDATTLDHYFPKGTFPEYSAFTPNLVPVCFQCNTRKRDDWDMMVARKYLHPFFDNIELQVVQCTIKKDGVKIYPSYDINTTGIADLETARTARTHWNEMALGIRYRRKAARLLGSLLESFLEETDMAALISYCSMHGRVLARESSNNWQTLLYSAVLQFLGTYGDISVLKRDVLGFKGTVAAVSMVLNQVPTGT